jgi:hypothetical protein
MSLLAAIDFPCLEVETAPAQFARYRVWAEYAVIDRDHWIIELDDFEATTELGMMVTDRQERSLIRQELTRWGNKNAGELAGRVEA